ncbi:unnamed protein product [Amoebophrya sp. A120]|nr:unnamed protein product [Amoebophrya sp. A120]|eukprot:GSA120T00015050001.1
MGGKAKQKNKKKGNQGKKKQTNEQQESKNANNGAKEQEVLDSDFSDVNLSEQDNEQQLHGRKRVGQPSSSSTNNGDEAQADKSINKQKKKKNAAGSKQTSAPGGAAVEQVDEIDLVTGEIVTKTYRRDSNGSSVLSSQNELRSERDQGEPDSSDFQSQQSYERSDYDPNSEEGGRYREDRSCSQSEDEEDYSDSDRSSRSGSSRSGSQYTSSKCSHSGDEDNPKAYKKGGYHPVVLGQQYGGRYRILSKLGAGAFSTVWLCADERNSDALVAMKICKSKASVCEQALDEVKLLRCINPQDQVAATDPKYEGRHYCMPMRHHFWHVGPNGKHMCLIFDLLGENLLALVKHTAYQGLPLPWVRKIARQVLQACWHMEKVGVIHTDIKLENVCVHRHDMKEVKEEAYAVLRSLKQAEKQYQDYELRRKQLNSGEAGKEMPTKLTKAQKKKMNQKKKKILAETAGVNLAHAGSGAALRNIHEISHPDVPEEEKIVLPDPPARQRTRFETFALSDLQCVLSDFGNGCWVDKHFTEEIQTRQYRAPEILIGADYDTTTDLWSSACMFFELLTGDFLFDPKSTDKWSTDEDQLALMIELLGGFPPKDWLDTGEYSGDFFTENCKHMLNIKKLHYWPLEKVLSEKYKVEQEEAVLFADFLLSMLRWRPADRVSAKEALEHPWISRVDEIDEHDEYMPVYSSEDEQDYDDEEEDDEDSEYTHSGSDEPQGDEEREEEQYSEDGRRKARSCPTNVHLTFKEDQDRRVVCGEHGRMYQKVGRSRNKRRSRGYHYGDEQTSQSSPEYGGMSSNYAAGSYYAGGSSNNNFACSRLSSHSTSSDSSCHEYVGPCGSGMNLRLVDHTPGMISSPSGSGRTAGGTRTVAAIRTKIKNERELGNHREDYGSSNVAKRKREEKQKHKIADTWRDKNALRLEVDDTTITGEPLEDNDAGRVSGAARAPDGERGASWSENLETYQSEAFSAGGVSPEQQKYEKATASSANYTTGNRSNTMDPSNQHQRAETTGGGGSSIEARRDSSIGSNPPTLNDQHYRVEDETGAQSDAPYDLSEADLALVGHSEAVAPEASGETTTTTAAMDKHPHYNTRATTPMDVDEVEEESAGPQHQASTRVAAPPAGMVILNKDRRPPAAQLDLLDTSASYPASPDRHA